MKPTLKINTINYIKVEDWDAFVQEIYQVPYCLQQQDGGLERGLQEFEVPVDSPDLYENIYAVSTSIYGKDRGVSFEAWCNSNVSLIKELLTNSKNNKLEHDGFVLFFYRKFYPSLQALANDLHAKGLIPEGKYAIIIDW